VVIGGASPLAHSGELFDRVNAEMPDFVKDLHTKGLLTVETYQASGNERKVSSPIPYIGMQVGEGSGSIDTALLVAR
jgi:hypothetical protein